MDLLAYTVLRLETHVKTGGSLGPKNGPDRLLTQIYLSLYSIHTLTFLYSIHTLTFRGTLGSSRKTTHDICQYFLFNVKGYVLPTYST